MKRFVFNALLILTSILAALALSHPSFAATTAVVGGSNGSSCNSGGYFTPSSITINDGDTVTFSVPANDPYAFGLQIHNFPGGNFTITPGNSHTTSALHANVSYYATWPSSGCQKGSGTVTVNPPPADPTTPSTPSSTPSSSGGSSSSSGGSASTKKTTTTPTTTGNASSPTSSDTPTSNTTPTTTDSSKAKASDSAEQVLREAAIVKPKSKLPVLLGGGVIVLAAGGGALWWFRFRKPKIPTIPKSKP